jgi:uncharacterized Zn finger protein
MLPSLTDATILSRADRNSYSRGMAYYQQGAVGPLILRSNTLSAEVEGSEPEPYLVRLTFDDGGVTEATCTCPYDWGGWCKHVVAVALKVLYEPETAEARPPLDELLAEASREELLSLVLALAADDPELADEVERHVLQARLAATPPRTAATAPAATRRSAVDQNAIRQQVRLAMRPSRRGRHDYYDYYDEEDPGDELVQNVRPVLEQAQRFSEAGDGHSALAVLEALTDAYITDGQPLFDEIEEMMGSVEGAASEFFGELAEGWAEALLTADLSAAERTAWRKKLAGWQEQADGLNQGDSFDLAVTAAEQGWDYPPLQRVLAGQIGEHGAWQGDAPEYADQLAEIRLRILERQGRQQEYLYLAEAEGLTLRYVAMLAKSGRTAEAVEAGLANLTTPEEVRQVATVLREQGDLDSALRLAEHGVTLKPATEQNSFFYFTERHAAELAAWASDLAAGMGYHPRALALAEQAFRGIPSLNAYFRVQELAGERWESVKPGLLKHLRQGRAAEAQVDIFLHEQLIDDAIKAVSNSYDYGLLARVMAVATPLRPDWVIQAATAQAERIIEAGKAESYVAAVDWLRRARDAYGAAGRMADWRAYLAALRTKHGRKHKLMGLLQQL